MSLTNPPSGPGSGSAGVGNNSARTHQSLKRGVQAAFDVECAAECRCPELLPSCHAATSQASQISDYPSTPIHRSGTQPHQGQEARQKLVMPLGSRPTAGHGSRQQQPQPQYPQLQQRSGTQWNSSAAAPHMSFAPSSRSGASSFLAPTSTHRNQNYAHRRIPEGVGRSGGYQPKARVTERYRIVGFISSGTYGRVYKAVNRNNIVTSTNGATVPTGHEVAIKKFKPDKEGEQISYTGISQSAIREMSLCSELNHANVIRLIEIILEDKCIFMVFDYAEHDLLQIIHHHTQQPRHPIPPATVKSIMFQLLNGCHYLHTNWVLHRDLKPANIMVTSSGGVKIGDLGLARRFDKPLHSLFSGDKVVVTIWYRAPELILGSYHYTPAIDMWAIGCIFAELLSLRPIFKGEEAKMDSKKTVPFQRNQMMKIMEIMGAPTKDKWPLLSTMPEFGQLNALQASMAAHHGRHSHGAPLASNLEKWYHNTISNAPSSTNTSSGASTSLSSLGQEGYRLLSGLLEYDPVRRLTAAQALQLPFFSTGDKVTANAFEGLKVDYPHRRVSQDDNDIRTSSLPGTKRSGLADDSLLRPSKRVRE